jgi:uncharacterized iron-regulated membrane protein
MALSGFALTLERSLLGWAEAAQRQGPDEPAQPLALETLLARVQARRPDLRVTGMSVAADPRRALELRLARGQVLYVERSSGRVLGAGAARLRAGFRQLEDWHRWLGTAGAARPFGRALTGASTLALGLLVASGAWLWWPTRVTAALLVLKTWPQRGLHGRAADFNWHNAAGFWCALPLLLIVGTGLVMAYPWADALLRQAVGAPAARARPARAPAAPDGMGAALDAATTRGLDACFERAALQVAGWRTLSWRWSPADDGRLVVTIDTGDDTRPDRRGQLTLARRDGTPLQWEPFSARDSGRRARAWVRALHTGEAGGALGQALAACASAGAVLLVWTGFSLAWRRLRAARRATARAGAGAPSRLASGWDVPRRAWRADSKGGSS